MSKLTISKRDIGEAFPSYFIADISANHDGSLQRAVDLIHLAAESGAEAAKFQNFRAPSIVSQRGFELLGAQLSHQASWKKPVFEVYKDASLPWEWTEILSRECALAGVDYLSTPYDLEAVDMLAPFVPAFKIGSGDITWLEMLDHVASKQKPVLLAAGASSASDVGRAMSRFLRHSPGVVLMQCNTNYTGDRENFRHIHLNVLRTFSARYPHAVLGLSDHTPGHATVLGAITLGARVIEKHFTDDNGREGPDHPFSMTPKSWREMVERSRELELSLGRFEKSVAANERETIVVQRRCLRAAVDLAAGDVITRDKIAILRPAPAGSLPPYDLPAVLGMCLKRPMQQGDCFSAEHLAAVFDHEDASTVH